VIRSQRSSMFETMFAMYVTRILKKHFFALHVSGEHFLEERDSSLPTVIYANHSNWWDGFVMLFFARRRWHIDSHLMMDVEQMRKYLFFKWLGVFSVDRQSPRGAAESIRHAVELLQGSGKILWIFPQGVLLPNDTRPMHLYTGLARIAQRLGRVNMLCMALRYEFGKEQRPEIYVRFSDPARIDGVPDAAALTGRLRDGLEQAVETLRQDVARGAVTEFAPAFRGKRSRNAMIDDLYQSRGAQ
jgi:chlorobactene lauroyltransferase